MKIYSIESVINESGLSDEEIRLMLMETNNKWETLKEVTEAERHLILESKRVKQLGDGSKIVAADPSQMSFQDQQTFVQLASQVLNTQIVLNVQEEILIADAIEQVKYQAIESNRNQRKKEYALQVQEQWQAEKEDYLGVLNTIADMVAPSIEVKAIQPEKRADKLVNDFLSSFQKKLVK